MKHLLITITVATILLSGCKKNTDSTDTELTHHFGWKREPFKTNYTIQFPLSYTGKMGPVQGNTFLSGHEFIKKDVNRGITIGYSYRVLLELVDFGDPIYDPNTPSMQVQWDFVPPAISFSNRVEFTLDGGLRGVLYHNNGPVVRGVLYWRDDRMFVEAVRIESPLQYFDEVVEILKTIRRR